MKFKHLLYTSMLTLLLAGCSTTSTNHIALSKTKIMPVMDSTWKTVNFGASTKYVTTAPSGDFYFGNATGVWVQKKGTANWRMVPNSDSIGPISEINFLGNLMVVSTQRAVFLYKNRVWNQITTVPAVGINVQNGHIYAKLPQTQNVSNQAAYFAHVPDYKTEVYENGKWSLSTYSFNNSRPMHSFPTGLNQQPVTTGVVISPKGTAYTIVEQPNPGLYQSGKLILSAKDIQKVLWSNQGQMAVLTSSTLFVQNGRSWDMARIPYPGAQLKDAGFELDGSVLVIDSEMHPYNKTPSMMKTVIWKYKNHEWKLFHEPKSFVPDYAVSQSGDIAMMTNQLNIYHDGSWKQYPVSMQGIHSLNYDAKGSLTAEVSIYNQKNSGIYRFADGRWTQYLGDEKPLQKIGLYWSVPYFQRNGDVLVYMFQNFGGYDLWFYHHGTWKDLNFHKQISNAMESPSGAVTVWTDSNAEYVDPTAGK